MAVRRAERGSADADQLGRAGARRRAAPARGRARRPGPRRRGRAAGRRGRDAAGRRRVDADLARPGRRTLSASASAGSAGGMPSSTDGAALLGRLERAPSCGSTSSASATSRPANTCGCRCTSLSTMPPATSSMVEAASSRLRGDAGVEVHLEQQVAELLAQVARVAGLDRLERLVGLLEQVRASDRWVCSRSQGHSRRSRSITATRSSSRAPGHVVRRVQHLDADPGAAIDQRGRERPGERLRLRVVGEPDTTLGGGGEQAARWRPGPRRPGRRTRPRPWPGVVEGRGEPSGRPATAGHADQDISPGATRGLVTRGSAALLAGRQRGDPPGRGSRAAAVGGLGGGRDRQRAARRGAASSPGSLPKRGSTETSAFLVAQALRLSVPSEIACWSVTFFLPALASSRLSDLDQHQLALGVPTHGVPEHLAPVGRQGVDVLLVAGQCLGDLLPGLAPRPRRRRTAARASCPAAPRARPGGRTGWRAPQAPGRPALHPAPRRARAPPRRRGWC